LVFEVLFVEEPHAQAAVGGEVEAEQGVLAREGAVGLERGQVGEVGAGDAGDVGGGAQRRLVGPRPLEVVLAAVEVADGEQRGAGRGVAGLPLADEARVDDGLIDGAEGLVGLVAAGEEGERDRERDEAQCGTGTAADGDGRHGGSGEGGGWVRVYSRRSWGALRRMEDWGRA